MSGRHVALQHPPPYLWVNHAETSFIETSKDPIMYHDELSREARLIMQGYQEYASLIAGRWQALLDWLSGN